MLQIISGKFFTRAERHTFERKAILYTNFAFPAPIQTCVGTLEPVDVFGSISSYVLSYTNQIEKGGVVVRVGDAEIVHQFRLLTILATRCFVATERSEVERHCRAEPAVGSDRYVPSLFLPRVFGGAVTLEASEISRFVGIVQKAISAPRKRYLGLIGALQALSDALGTVSYSVDLAYSTLVYCIEALSQRFDDFWPVWADYDERMRRKLDPLLEAVDPKVAQDLRNALLDSHALRLKKRFVKFARDHVEPSFFEAEARDVPCALRPSQLERALKNAYDVRSHFVHTLRPLVPQLRFPGVSNGDVFMWQGEPYMTLSGLARLVFHLLRNFVLRSESLEHENIPWRQQLPGTVTLPIAPQHWIFDVPSFDLRDAGRRFSAFIEHVAEVMRTGGAIVDLRSLFEKCEELLPRANQSQRRAVLALYALYQNLIVPEARSPGWHETIERHQDSFNECCIEMLILCVLLGAPLPWSLADCLTAYETYDKSRFSRDQICLPPVVEAALLASLANAALDVDSDQRQRLLERAVHEAAGQPAVQTYIHECAASNTSVDIRYLLTGKRESVEDPNDAPAHNGDGAGASESP